MADYQYFILILLVVSSVEKVSINEFAAPPLVTIDVSEVMGTMKKAMRRQYCLSISSLTSVTIAFKDSL